MMPHSLAVFITHYGYPAIFSLVFLQELGVPNPVPNELVLLFSGYLAFLGTLNFALIFLTVVTADFIGTSILYFVFYFFGGALYRKLHKGKFLDKLQKIETNIYKNGQWGIYLGRLVPYARGYVSVVAGLVRVPPKEFLMTVFLSAVTWSGGYVIAGRILGKQWEKVVNVLGFQTAVILLLLVVLVVFMILRMRKKNPQVIE
jgi:membrane protein DedA with SNARE-associated domain